MDAIESVTFIGYPNGVWDKENLLPVARRGTTATPLAVDFERTPRFVIDASVFGGSSGSPVFVLNHGMYTDKRANTIVGSRVIFVGVVAAVFYRTELNQIISVPIPTAVQPMAQQREMVDLGIVLRRWSQCSPICGTTNAWTGSRCAARRKLARSGACTVWSTTSRSSLATAARRKRAERQCQGASEPLSERFRLSESSETGWRARRRRKTAWRPLRRCNRNNEAAENWFLHSLVRRCQTSRAISDPASNLVDAVDARPRAR